MTVQIAVILAFALGVFCGIQWVHASRLDRADRLVATIIKLRAELAHERLSNLATWMREDDS